MSEVEVIYSLPSAYSGFVNITRPAEYFTACYTVCSVPKRPNKVETVVHARLPFNSFQFGLYRVVAPLSSLRSITLASLFTSLSIFGWSDLLQILRTQAAFLFAVLCIISTVLKTSRFFFFYPACYFLKNKKELLREK